MSHRVASKVAVTCFIALGTIGCLTGIYKRRRRRKRGHDSYEALIGNTPFLKLEKLSALLGQGKSLYVKMECMNPGGSGKDRAALYMIQSAEENEELPLPLSDGKSYRHQAYLNLFMDVISSSPHDDLIKKVIEDAVSRTKTGGIVIEGSSGSTGISLATLAARRGHSAIIVMPDDQAQEKRTILSCLGASVHVVPTAAISNPNQYVNVAKRVADIINVTDRQVSAASQLQGRYFKAAFMNQFENMANYKAHYATTGPEILSQSLEAFGKSPDAFLMSAGTGGTISGVAHFFQESDSKSVKVVLVDPPGSCLYNKVKLNVAYTSEQEERRLHRHRYDTIAEGIGLDRITQNLALGLDLGVIDDAVKVSDQEAVDIAHWLLKEEGIFVGSSSAMNISAAVRYADLMPSGSFVVTVICDGGQRHLSRFWNKDFIQRWGLKWPGDDMVAWNERLPYKIRINTIELSYIS